MKWLLRQERSSILYSAILMIVLGIVLTIFPQVTMRVIGYILGGVLVCFGVVQTVRYFASAQQLDLFRYTLLLGLLSLTLGIVALVGPEVVLSILPFLFGLVVLVGSFMKVQYALNLKRAGYARWWGILVMALAAMILGILILADPFGAMAVTVMFIGISLIAGGVTDIWTYTRLMRLMKQIPGK